MRSMYRHQLDVAMKEGKVPLKFDAAPFSADDPTSEIKRMHFEVWQLKVLCYGIFLMFKG